MKTRSGILLHNSEKSLYKHSNEDTIYIQKCTESARVQILTARFYFSFSKVEHK